MIYPNKIMLPDGTIYLDATTQDATPHLYQIKHDYELSTGVRIAASTLGSAPEVFRLEPHMATVFTKEWQLFCFDVYSQQRLDLSTGTRASKFSTAYDSCMMNDNRFRDGRANFIKRENMDAECPRVFNLVFGGNILSGIEDGEDLIVETLNGSNPPPLGISPTSHPWLFQKATIITNTKTGIVNGIQTYKVIRFPGLSPADTIMPIISPVPVRFPLAGLKKLQEGSPLPSPYNFG